MAIIEFADIDKWIDVKERLPEIGVEIILFNGKWIDEDFNPNGTRVGFIDDRGWTSAYELTQKKTPSTPLGRG
jgi:hypothetical protein